MLSNNSPASVGILLLQESAVTTEVYGYMFFLRAQPKRKRVNVTGVRKYIMKRPDCRTEHAAGHYIQANIETCRGMMAIINVYLPPEGALDYDAEVNERMAGAGAGAGLGGDMNWIGAKSMQATVQQGYGYDTEKGEGKRYTTNRDDDVWLN